jgi:hypothetical protein
MTLIALASKLTVKSSTDGIKADLKYLNDMLKLAKKLVSENDFVANIETQIKDLKSKRKELVKNFEKGAKNTYSNPEGDFYKCEIIWESEDYTEILYWVPYMEHFTLEKITDKSQIA